MSIQAPPDWATPTLGGLIVLGPSRRSVLRTLAPSTPPMLRPDDRGSRQRALLCQPPQGIYSAPLIAEGHVIARPSHRPGMDNSSMQASSGGMRACSSAMAGEASDWAVLTLGGLQITGPSQRWIVRQSAPSTPTLMRPSTAQPALQRARLSGPADLERARSETVRMSSLMLLRFGAALNRLNELVHAGEDEPPIADGDVSANELVLQLEMIVDQLEAAARQGP